MVDLVDTRRISGQLAAPRGTIEPQPVGFAAKRAIDVIIAISAIVLLAPLFVLCFLACAVTSGGGSVIYRHRRVGFQGKHFDCLKFRTMVQDADACLSKHLASDPAALAEWRATRKLQHDPRITAFGAVLRKTSLDELPQLINVLKGEMSIVGPRPVTDDELAFYSTNLNSYLACRPGITGLWQISGRSTTTYSRRVACDTFYAQNWSMLLDGKILIFTIPAIFDSEAAY